MTNFNQFSEISCKTQTVFKRLTYFLFNCTIDKISNTENNILPGSFTQFQPQSQVKTVGIEQHNPFGVQQTICSKPLTEGVPISPSISTFPPTCTACSRAKNRATISTFTSIFQRITSNTK